MLDFYLNLFFVLAPNHSKLMFKERIMKEIDVVQGLKREKGVERKEVALDGEKSYKNRLKKTNNLTSNNRCHGCNGSVTPIMGHYPFRHKHFEGDFEILEVYQPITVQGAAFPLCNGIT